MNTLSLTVGSSNSAFINAHARRRKVSPVFHSEWVSPNQDSWRYREEAFGKQPRPFVGWLMMVEDALKSRSPVGDSSPHFPVFVEFKNASYLERYDLLCHKLVHEQLYTTASLITSKRSAAASGEFSEMSTMTGLKAFATALAGHAAAETARLG